MGCIPLKVWSLPDLSSLSVLRSGIQATCAEIKPNSQALEAALANRIHAFSAGALIRIIAFIFMAIGITTSLHGQELDRVFRNLPPGRATTEEARFEGVSRADVVRIDTVDQPFQSVYACLSLVVRPNNWDTQIRWRTSEAIIEGDIMMAVFWARTVEPYPDAAESKIEVVVEYAKPPYRRSLSSRIHLTKDWQRYFLPFACNRDYAVGDATFSFRFGERVISWELAQPFLINYGTSVQLKDLPDSRTQQGAKN